MGREPVENGDPGTAVSMPELVLTENTDNELAPWLATKRRLWTESNAMNSAPAPAGNGEPETGVRPPEVLTVNAETVPEPELDTKARLCADAGVVIMLLLLPMLPHPLAMNRTPRLAIGTTTDKNKGAASRNLKRERIPVNGIHELHSYSFKTRDSIPQIRFRARPKEC